MLRTPHDLGRNPHLPHLLVEHGDDVGQVLLALRAGLGHHAGDLLVLVGLQVEEGEVLQLPLDGVDAEAVGDGGVDLQRLAGLEDAPVLAQGRQCAHVVQAVGQLDDDDADVLGHGHEHLANGGRLLVGERLHLDAGDLGDALHQRPHLRVEGALHLLGRHLRVLHGVVEQRRRDGLGVHAQIGQDDAHLDGMDDERLAGLAALARVGVAGELEGAAQHGLLRRVHVGTRQARQLGEAVLGRGGPALDGRIGRGMRAAQKRVHGLLRGLPGADGIGRRPDGIVSLGAHGRLPSPERGCIRGSLSG